MEQVQKDGKTETNLTSSVRIEHFRDPILGKARQDPKAAGLWKVVTYKPLAHDKKNFNHLCAILFFCQLVFFRVE